jgi:uncharacterized membrane protein
MREWLVAAMEFSIVVIDATAFLVIVVGTVDVAIRALRAEIGAASREEKRAVWLRYARFLVMALTFQLAADIIETSISTSWEAIGRLAAIAVIRTFLEFFLERDVSEVRGRQHGAREQAVSKR